jgi:hypothetical protein
LLDDAPPTEHIMPNAVAGRSHMTESATPLHPHNSVVKVVKKFEIQTLCPQHNPVSCLKPLNSTPCSLC